MRLHRVTHIKGAANYYCGPSVLSIIIGKTTTEMVSRIRYWTGRQRITGTEREAVRCVLDDYGFKVHELAIDPRGSLTFGAWLDETARHKGEMFVIVARNHYQAVCGNRYACGLINRGRSVSITDRRIKRRAIVTDVWRVDQ